MKRLLKIAIVLLATTVVPFCFAEKDNQTQNQNNQNIDSNNQEDNIKTQSGSQIDDNNEENPEQKSNSGELTKEDKKELEKISKGLNNLLIETYKSKYSAILNNLSNNIKDKKKEDKIKILSSLIISIKPRIELIKSGKVNLTENRKEVLLALLNYIVQDTEKRIQALSKEK